MPGCRGLAGAHAQCGVVVGARSRVRVARGASRRGGVPVSAGCAWPGGRWAEPFVWGERDCGPARPVREGRREGGPWGALCAALPCPAAPAWEAASPGSGVSVCEASPSPNGPPLQAVERAGLGRAGPGQRAQPLLCVPTAPSVCLDCSWL